MKKSNNSLNPIRYPFDYCMSNFPRFADLVKRNISALQTLLAKNEHLLKLNEISPYKQVMEINKGFGYCINRSTYSKYKLGKLPFCPNLTETVIAGYWGMSPDELRALDISLWAY